MMKKYELMMIFSLTQYLLLIVINSMRIIHLLALLDDGNVCIMTFFFVIFAYSLLVVNDYK